MSSLDASIVPADILINARWVIPVEPSGTVLENYTVAIRHGRILDLVPQSQAHRRFQANESVDLPSHALIPGLVNAHTHAAMSLLRGLADDLPLMTWLEEHIWPAENQHVSAEFVRDGAELAIAEMLLSGTTCFNDMYFFPEVVARSAVSAGMRATLGMILIDFPSAWGSGPEEYLAKGLALRDEYKNHPLLGFSFAPHAPYTVQEKWLREIRVLADELEVGVHTHVHETADEVEQSIRSHGCRPLARLAELGLLNPGLMAVHMTQLENEEIRELATQGVNVVHCPESNLKLASGFCPVAKLVRDGVNVALGTDGAASNNNLDMFAEIRTAALLAKGVAGDPAAIPAHSALAMATINGAKALGLADELGSLQPGKWADITAVNLDVPGTQPVYEPISQLVYATGSGQVSDVWVAGRRLLQERRLTTLDSDDILRRTHAWQQRIAAPIANRQAAQPDEKNHATT